MTGAYQNPFPLSTDGPISGARVRMDGLTIESMRELYNGLPRESRIAAEKEYTQMAHDSQGCESFGVDYTEAGKGYNVPILLFASYLLTQDPEYMRIQKQFELNKDWRSEARKRFSFLSKLFK